MNSDPSSPAPASNVDVSRDAVKVSSPPVFVFTTGPCAGGKSLQQLLSASHELLVWSGTGGALRHTLEGLRQMDLAASPAMVKVLGGAGRATGKNRIPRGTDVRSIVGSLRLAPSHLLRSYRQLFRRLYEVPAQGHGFSRWGLIESTGDRFVVDMLRLLHPDARFIFLVRDPLSCLAEIKARKLQARDGWGKQVSTGRMVWFARQWAALAAEFSSMDAGLAVRFEDIIENEALSKELNDYLQLKLSSDMLRSWRADLKSRTEIPKLDQTALKQIMPIINEQRRHWKYV